MRRIPIAWVLLIGPLAQWSAGTSPAFASSTAPPTCGPKSVRIITYKANVATGSVDELYWIENVGSQRCSLRGFVRDAYVGNYSGRTDVKKTHSLVVQEADSRGVEDAELGGIKSGLPLPTVTLSPRGGMVSFWIAGTDEQFRQGNGRPSRCIVSYKMLAWLPGTSTPVTVAPQRAGVFFWCGAIRVNPILAGRSGPDPLKPLSFYFGTSD